jgi:DNA replication protein DnaC
MSERVYFSKSEPFCQDALRWALWWAEQGVKVLPLEPKEKRPHRLLAPEGLYNATNDPLLISSWFEREPHLNYGVLCGERIVVVDIDLGDPKKRAREEFERFERELGQLPGTYFVRTGRGGLHLYFRLPSAITVRTRKYEWGEIRAGRAYVVGAGSRTDYGSYFWEEEQPTRLEDLPILPERWLQEICEESSRERRERRGSKPLTEPTEIEIAGEIVVLDPEAELPERFTRDLERDERLRQYWEKKGLGPSRGDDSQSGWDLTLANALVLRNYTIQEIADVLIVYRRKHGADLKYAGYYAHTIEKALESKRGEKMLVSISQPTDRDLVGDDLPFSFPDEEEVKITPIIPNLLNLHDLVLLYGQPGVGKTTFLLDLCSVLLNRKRIGPLHCDLDNVFVLFMSEQGKGVLEWARRKGLNKGIAFLFRHLSGPINEEIMQKLEEVCKRLNKSGRIPVLIIDSLHGFFKFRDKGEWSAGEVRDALKPLDDLTEKYDLAVILADHPNKRGDPANSEQFLAIADSVFLFKKVDRFKRRLETVKSRYTAPISITLYFDSETRSYVNNDSSDSSVRLSPQERIVMQAIRQLYENDPDRDRFNASDLKVLLQDFEANKLGAVLSRLRKKGAIDRDENGYFVRE